MTRELFRLADPWGDEVVLTEARWERIVSKHPEVAPYVTEVRATIAAPNVVYEGRHALTTKVFYARGLIEDPPFDACWVQVVVRYTEQPAVVSTALLPFRIAADLGQVLHLRR